MTRGDSHRGGAFLGEVVPGGLSRSGRIRRRALRTIVPSWLTAVILGTLVAPGLAGGPCTMSVTDTWASIDPRFPVGPRDIVSYAVSPSDPRLLFVTNGRVVVSSGDGGCSFQQVLDLGSSNLSSASPGAMIKDLDVAWETQPRVMVAIDSPAVGVNDVMGTGVEGPLPRAHVAASPDGGGTWQEVGRGLEGAFGAPTQIVAGGGQLESYLLVDGTEVGEGPTRRSLPQALYALPAGGDLWEVRNTFGTPRVSQLHQIDGISIDPITPQELWLYGNHGLLRSRDGGATFEPPNPGAAVVAPVGVVSIFHRPDEPAHILAFSANTAHVFTSNDGGSTFAGLPTPAVVDSSDHGARGGEFAFSTVQGRVFHVIPGHIDPFDISDAKKSISDLRAVFGGGHRILYGRTTRTIERRAAPEPPAVKDGKKSPPPRPIDPDLRDRLATLKAPEFVPPHQRIVLRRGEPATLEYRLLLPGVRKADIAFLIDLSGSMGEEIDGLREALESIVNELVDAKIQAHFGVGGYRTYFESPAYRRFRDIGPPGPELEQALRALRAAGGDNDDETALAALYQMATGEGQDEGMAFIPPNQQMNFRSDALRVVVHGTDEELSEKPPRPRMTTAATALRDVRAVQVGLSFEGNQDPFGVVQWPATESLRRMAGLTGAFAPQGGIDCEGDGSVDLAEGEPLVCVIPSSEAELARTMGSAIVELVKAISDRRDVRLEVGTGDEVVEDIQPPRHSLVDFAVPQVLDFEVSVRCEEEGPDRSYPVALEAVSRGSALAGATAEVICLARVPDVGTPSVPSTTSSVLAGFPFPPIPPPPPPPGQLATPARPVQGPSTQLQSQAQSQAQGQSQAQAQPGLVAQKQEQAQTALAQASNKLVEQEGYEMSARGRSRNPQRLPLALGAGAICLAYGCLLRLRTRVRPAEVRRR